MPPLPPLPLTLPVHVAPSTSIEPGVVGFSYGGQKWSRGKAAPMMQPIQHLYCGLPANGHNLNSFQLQTIYNCMNAVKVRFPNDHSGVKYCQAVADEWNKGHEAVHIHHPDSVGFGGRITDKQVMAFLKAQGSATISSNLGVVPVPIGYTSHASLPFSHGGMYPQQIFSQPMKQDVVYGRPPRPKKQKMDLPEGYDDPSKVNGWTCRELERIIYEFGGKQRGNEEEKKTELRGLLSKYRKKGPSK